MTTTNMSQVGCVVVGGGPGGMVLALLLARQGVDVLLLEARENFEREFRGDTVLDLLWMRLPQLRSDPPRSYGLYAYGEDQFVVSDRGDEWQIGFILPKASYTELRKAGIQTLREKLGRVMPWLADRTDLLRDWENTSLLVVQVGRVQQWYRRGLLLIGDAAHVMSPVYGIGINYAIQDAVVAANVLGPRLREGDVRARDLRAVQHRREWPMRVMQWLQEVQKYKQIATMQPPGMRMAAWLVELPPMRNLRSRLIAFGGFRPERVQSARQAPRISSTSDTRDAESRRHRRASSASASQSAAANARQSQNLASSS